jgi:hypothetical protein
MKLKDEDPEDLFSHIKKAQAYVTQTFGRPAFAAIMRENVLEMLLKACKEYAGMELPEKSPTLFGLKLESNAFMPDDQILVIPEDMYIRMKKNQANMN